MDRKPVELVRVEREEEYFDREEVLGRDASSVFPNEIKKANALDPEALKMAIGGDRKFISATELEEIKKQRGLSVEDGTLAPSKPLAEILREAKEKKEAEFQDMWKQMKTGKNRPLDEEELEFLDSMASAAAEQERSVRQQEEDELAAFHEALRQQEEAKAKAAEQAAASKAQHAAAHRPAAAHKRARPKPAVVVVKAVPAQRAGSLQQAQQAAEGREGDSGAAAGAAAAGAREPAGPSIGTAEGQPVSKRARGEQGDEGAAQRLQGSGGGGGAAQEEEVGLPGLLGGYGSGSDSDS